MTGFLRNALFSGAIFLFALSAPAFADQTDERLVDLFDRLKTSEDFDASQLEERIWEIWSASQSATADVLMERAEAALAAGDIDLAATLAEHVTGIAPSFAEGWHFLARLQIAEEKFDEAAASLERTIELEPRHFGAYSALGELFMTLGQEKAAFDMFEQALSHNPHYETAVQAAESLRARVKGRGI